jgi:hypothetical protein
MTALYGEVALVVLLYAVQCVEHSMDGLSVDAMTTTTQVRCRNCVWLRVAVIAIGALLCKDAIFLLLVH